MLSRHWIYFVSNGVLALFLGIIVYVIFTAYGRSSGSTGLDMAKIQKMRFEAVQRDSNPSFTPTPP